MDLSKPMEMEEEEEPNRVILGLTVLAKTREQIPDDLYEDVEFIFHTSHLRILNNSYKGRAGVTFLPIFRKAKLRQYEKELELPRRLPTDYDLSECLLLSFEHVTRCSVMLFVVDMRNLSLFHVVSKKFKELCSSSVPLGYALIDGRLYFVGGCNKHRSFDYRLRRAYERSMRDRLRRGAGNYSGCNALCWKANQMVRKSSVTPHLHVPTYNLKERAWEKHTPCLTAPKPRPVVFAYEGKIFAIRGAVRGPDDSQLPDSPAFEFLDTNPPIHTRKRWTELPAPPFDMKEYKNHILDEANGIFFLFFHPYHYTKEPDTCRLYLTETPYRWESAPKSNPICKSWPYPHPIGSSGGHRMRHISDGQSHGCIVDNILFSYEKDDRPFILGKYVGWDKSRCGPWEIDGLDKVIVGKADTSESLSFLNHIGNYRFCLIVQDYRGFESSTNPLYSLIFDLVKEDLPNEFRMIKTPNASKKQKAKKFKFVFKPVSEKAFQVPLDLTVCFCKKL